jgi:hypothetical protein
MKKVILPNFSKFFPYETTALRKNMCTANGIKLGDSITKFDD